MAPTYFLPPDFLSYPAPQEGNPAPAQGNPAPEGGLTPQKGNQGPIQLGQLISDHKDPGQTVASLAPLNLAKYGIFPNKVFGSAMEHKNSESSSSHASLFLKAVQLVGIKLGFSIQDADSKSLLSEIEEIEAQSVVVTNAYVKDSMLQTEAQEWIKRGFFEKTVYVVDGILIARPRSDKSKVLMSAQATSDASGAFEAGGQPAQVPASGGGAFQRKTSKEYGLGFVPRTPFIYGFRIRECFYRKGRAESKAFTKGTKLAAERGQEEPIVEEEAQFVFSGLADEDVTVDDLGEGGYGLEGLKVWDDAEGEECTVVAQR